VICVFPNGGMSGYQDRPDEKVMGETLIVKELVPLIDRTYRTRANRNGRVLTGFSMGGGGAVRLALKHPELFSAAGSWAGALVPRRGGFPPELETENLRRTAGKVRLLLIVGDKDLTFGSHQPVAKNLKEAEFPHQHRVLEGVSHRLDVYYEKTGDELVRFLTAGFEPGS
jgi:endo-1,4-beta-xylanase